MFTNFKDKIFILSLCIVLHLGVLYGYWADSTYNFHPKYWARQFTVAIFLLLFLSIILPFIKSWKTRGKILAIKVVTVFALAIPFAGNPGIYSLIYALVIFEGFVFLPLGFALLLSASCLVYSTWISFSLPTLWLNSIPQKLDLSALITSWTECFFSGIIGYLLSKNQKLRLKEREMSNQLQISNNNLANAIINLQNLAATAEQSTMVRERSRIAREIHDSLIYTLTNLLALLNAYREKLNAVNKIIPDELNQARELVLLGLNDVRHFLNTIHPKDYEEDIGLGKIKRLVTVFSQATGVEVELNFGDVPQFIDKKLEQVVYRIVQEGLTNSFRHGKATQIFINFNLFKNGTSLSIKDNGCGVELIKCGYGLTGIRERVEELGGKIKIISRVEDGFTLQVWFPLKGGITDG